MEKHFLRSFAFVHKARQYTQNRNMSHVAHKPSIFGCKKCWLYRKWEIPLNSNIWIPWGWIGFTDVRWTYKFLVFPHRFFDISVFRHGWQRWWHAPAGVCWRRSATCSCTQATPPDDDDDDMPPLGICWCRCIFGDQPERRWQCDLERFVQDSFEWADRNASKLSKGIKRQTASEIGQIRGPCWRWNLKTSKKSTPKWEAFPIMAVASAKATHVDRNASPLLHRWWWRWTPHLWSTLGKSPTALLSMGPVRWVMLMTCRAWNILEHQNLVDQTIPRTLSQVSSKPSPPYAEARATGAPKEVPAATEKVLPETPVSTFRPGDQVLIKGTTKQLNWSTRDHWEHQRWYLFCKTG